MLPAGMTIGCHGGDVVIDPPAKSPRFEPYPRESGDGSLSQGCVKRITGPWGGFVLNVHGGGTSQASGHPDLIASVLGRCCAIELKQPGKEPTPKQYRRLRQWRDAGALAGWVTTERELDALLVHVLDLDWENPQLIRLPIDPDPKPLTRRSL